MPPRTARQRAHEVFVGNNRITAATRPFLIDQATRGMVWRWLVSTQGEAVASAHIVTPEDVANAARDLSAGSDAIPTARPRFEESSEEYPSTGDMMQMLEEDWRRTNVDTQPDDEISDEDLLNFMEQGTVFPTTTRGTQTVPLFDRPNQVGELGGAPPTGIEMGRMALQAFLQRQGVNLAPAFDNIKGVMNPSKLLKMAMISPLWPSLSQQQRMIFMEETGVLANGSNYKSVVVVPRLPMKQKNFMLDSAGQRVFL